MRKQEEEMFRGKDGVIDRKAWVNHHKFPEDLIAEWFAERNVKTTRGYAAGHARCSCCNYSTDGLHDQTLNASSGRRSKWRKMFRDGDHFVCEYCYNVEQQYFELEKKKELYVDGLEVNTLANLLRQEDLELLK